MSRKKVVFLWILFFILIPLLYFLLKLVILPNAKYIEYIILLAPYLFGVFTFMYRVDERLYFLYNKIRQWFVGTDTSWIFSTRYYNVSNNDLFINSIIEYFKKNNCKVLKSEKDFLSIHWRSKYIFSFRMEQDENGEYSLHFYTSIIEVSFRSIKKKINELSLEFENIENKINMPDRGDKQYQIDITYNDISPYYSFWVKALPGEKIISFNCSIKDDENSIITVDKNIIRYKTNRSQDLFSKIEKYLNLKGG